MASYVVVGASRGLGFEFLRQLSANPANIVIGLVRSVDPAKAKVEAELNRPNIHILHYDLDDSKTLPAAVAGASEITGGKLDYLVANAGIGGDHYSATISELAKDPETLDKEFTTTFRTNAIGMAQVIGAFMPLILLGTAKKVFAISSGLGETDLTRQYDVWMGVAYSISKAALNMIIAKYSAEYREQGVVFLAISPGIVDTGMNISGEEAARVLQILGGKMMTYEPNWKGPITPEESINQVMAVAEKSKIDDGNAGDMISHLGSKRWV